MEIAVLIVVLGAGLLAWSVIMLRRRGARQGDVPPTGQRPGVWDGPRRNGPRRGGVG